MRREYIFSYLNHRTEFDMEYMEKIMSEEKYLNCLKFIKNQKINEKTKSLFSSMLVTSAIDKIISLEFLSASEYRTVFSLVERSNFEVTVLIKNLFEISLKPFLPYCVSSVIQLVRTLNTNLSYYKLRLPQEDGNFDLKDSFEAKEKYDAFLRSIIMTRRSLINDPLYITLPSFIFTNAYSLSMAETGKFYSNFSRTKIRSKELSSTKDILLGEDVVFPSLEHVWFMAKLYMCYLLSENSDMKVKAFNMICRSYYYDSPIEAKKEVNKLITTEFPTIHDSDIKSHIMFKTIIREATRVKFENIYNSKETTISNTLCTSISAAVLADSNFLCHRFTEDPASNHRVFNGFLFQILLYSDLRLQMMRRLNSISNYELRG